MLAITGVPSAQAASRTATCVVQVDGEAEGNIEAFRSVSAGSLIGSTGGLFLFDGKRVSRVGGQQFSGTTRFFDSDYGLLVKTDAGLARYDGQQLVALDGAATGWVYEVRPARGRLVVASANGFFSYDGKQIEPIPGANTGEVAHLYDLPFGLLLGGANGLHVFDGATVSRFGGDAIGRVTNILKADGGPLVVAASGIYRIDGNRVVRPPGSDVKDVQQVIVTSRGILLNTFSNLYRYDAKGVSAIEGDDTGYFQKTFDTPLGVLVSAERGLFVYDGARIARVSWQSRGLVGDVRNTPAGPLVSADTGLFRFDGKALTPVGGGPTGDIKSVLPTTDGLLLGADKGLFRFDGARVDRVEGEETAGVDTLHETPQGVLLSADNGFFLVVGGPLASAKVALDNAKQLNDSAPNEGGVLTRWKLSHPCAKFAEKFPLRVVATNERGEDAAAAPAFDFQFHGGDESFASLVPVAKAGKWRFRVVVGADKAMLGASSEPVTFVAGGFWSWLQAWGKTLTTGTVSLLALFNLAVFAAARYSPAAWRLATDDIWGKTALAPQGFLLRQWRSAQLWLLDLYVRGRCSRMRSARPFLAVPLTNARGQFVDSDAVLSNFRSVRRLWIQGGAGMGKTALFHHLHETHFGGAERTSFAIFRRDGYLLVPIEARRFSDTGGDGDTPAWVTECVRSVLSENGLTLDDRGLVQAMLSKGTLAVAIDGLNEVARSRAVATFAASFPNAPLFLTSQELGEEPFEVWRLPGTISQHVEGMLTLYLGAEAARPLSRRLKDNGLFEYLRSGYDVRLVIDLASADPEGRNLPGDRIGLYRAAVAAGWPEGDDRLDLLQAAAWKLISDRGPNEDKRRLRPDIDAPVDLLERLEAVREQSGRSIRLVRAAPPGYEFVHDQMNAYLAACWFVDRPSIAVMKAQLQDTKAWLDGREAQRVLWGFVASLIDRTTLERLWVFAGDDEERVVLGTALAERARREGWSLTRSAGPADAAPEAHGAVQ
jgi:hypothetical protein